MSAAITRAAYFATVRLNAVAHASKSDVSSWRAQCPAADVRRTEAPTTLRETQLFANVCQRLKADKRRRGH